MIYVRVVKFKSKRSGVEKINAQDPRAEDAVNLLTMPVTYGLPPWILWHFVDCVMLCGLRYCIRKTYADCPTYS